MTIQKRGVFSLNEAAFVALGEPTAVVFLFDAKRQIVGMRAADPTDDNAYPLRLNAKGTTHLVTGTQFTNHYDIPADSGRRFEAAMEGDVLCIDLTQGKGT